MGTVAAAISVILNGILMGGVYGLTSSAWSFQCGALKFANFGYGASIMLSMYITYFGLTEWNLGPIVTFILVLVLNVLLGLGMRLTVLRKSDRSTQILCTMGLQMIIINLVNFIFTSYPRTLALFETRFYFTDTISIGLTQLFCFVLAAVILISFQLFLSFTWTGRAIRAVVQNRDVANLMGIKSDRILNTAFALSYVLIGISGLMMMLMYQVEPNFGNSIQSIAFLVCVSAGLGSLGGAFFSGILVGVTSALINYFIGATYHDPILYSLFIIILLVRPFGIFTKKSQVARTL